MRGRPSLDLTAEEARRFVHYDPETGLFTRLVAGQRNHKSTQVGSLIGYHNKITGYVRLRFGPDRSFSAHLVAWLWMTGAWPASEIDHRDRVRNNNRWTNLRPAVPAQQAANSSIGKRNKSGFKGVYRQQAGLGWCAQIGARKSRRHLGIFPTPEEAHKAYERAAVALYGEFANAATATPLSKET